ncbi:MAG: CPBP family intramembrane metalloprotease [Bacteroidaceae bacterium]|nr:CPBP family intramembrane metalloprotease [Bacteroidaceae bacterium]
MTRPTTTAASLPPIHGELVRLAVSIAVAAALWTLMFSPCTAPYMPFWSSMTAAALVLTGLALTFGGPASLGLGTAGRNASRRRFAAGSLLLGVAIAAALWVVFWVGDKVSQWMFAFARGQVDLIYGMKGTMRPAELALLLLFIIGPAEEIFWRGYVQRTLARRYSPAVAFVATTAVYALVHLPSANFMLIMAALVCGVAWGGLYWLMPRRLGAIIVSHALWDAAAFVWLPF